jgi:hypothetical protein
MLAIDSLIPQERIGEDTIGLVSDFQKLNSKRGFSMLISKKSIGALAFGVALISSSVAVPAQATPALDCVVSSSFDGFCLLQPGATITGELKAGNGGAGGIGGAGGDAYLRVHGGGMMGFGGNGGVGAKIPYSYTNTSGTVMTIHFAVGTNGTAGANGTAGSVGTISSQNGTNGSNALDGTDGTATIIEDSNSIALFTANPGTKGTGGTGGTGATTSADGVPGVRGTAGTAGAGSSITTTGNEQPFSSILTVGVAAPTTPTPTLAATGQNGQDTLTVGLVGSLMIAMGISVLYILRRKSLRD